MMKHPFLYTRAKSRGKTIFTKEEYKKMIGLSAGEILVKMQHKDPIYKKMIESFSVYFSSDELLDYITRHAPPREVGEFYQMLKFVNRNDEIEGVFKALWYRFLNNDIRIFFIGMLENMEFEDLSLWMHGLKPLTLERLRYYYDKGLPYLMLKKAGLPKSVIDEIIDASKRNEIGRISFALYRYYMKMLAQYPVSIAKILADMEIRSLIIKANLLHLSEEKVKELLKDISKSYAKKFDVKAFKVEEGKGCCMLHTEAKDFLKYYKSKVNDVEAVIAYLLIKEIQSINLRLLAKHKALGLSEDEVLSRLIAIR
ncbi:MAG: hypothetical protein GXN99_01785 [Candidatus Nanohaloarchaeota archaeon]|nr:hypothetical protein [Candidatus Nanohaloarchaeota archaeon]